MEDQEIIDMFFERDEGALEETSKKYGSILNHISQNILKDVHEAGECFNDVLLGAWNNIPPTRPDNFLAYLAKSIRYISFGRLDYRNAEKRSAELVELSAEMESSIPTQISEEMISESKEISAHISTFLRGIKYEQRIIFVRRYWYGDTILDIANQFSISKGKVKSSLFRTRNKLKEYLESEGINI